MLGQYTLYLTNDKCILAYNWSFELYDVIFIRHYNLLQIKTMLIGKLKPKPKNYIGFYLHFLSNNILISFRVTSYKYLNANMRKKIYKNTRE